jgi:hypothetical protein
VGRASGHGEQKCAQPTCRGQPQGARANRNAGGGGFRLDGSLAASARWAHARSGGGGAVAAGDFIEFAGKFGEPLRCRAEQFRGGAAGLRQHLGFEQVADTPGFLFESADNVFQILHELLTR